MDKSCLLLRYILQTLTKCFLYDKSGFLTKERFDTLLQPLVDQVDDNQLAMQHLVYIYYWSLCMWYN